MSLAQERYDALAAALLAADPDVTQGRAFRDGVLKVGRRIFAMPAPDALIVKLPADRCAELVQTHGAEPFRRGGAGPQMREWVAIDVRHADAWPDLALEALTFVRGRQG